MYNERVIQGGIKPNLAALFLSVADQMDDKVMKYIVKLSS